MYILNFSEPLFIIKLGIFLGSMFSLGHFFVVGQMEYSCFKCYINPPALPCSEMIEFFNSFLLFLFISEYSVVWRFNHVQGFSQEIAT